MRISIQPLACPEMVIRLFYGYFLCRVLYGRREMNYVDSSRKCDAFYGFCLDLFLSRQSSVGRVDRCSSGLCRRNDDSFISADDLGCGNFGFVNAAGCRTVSVQNDVTVGCAARREFYIGFVQTDFFGAECYGERSAGLGQCSDRGFELALVASADRYGDLFRQVASTHQNFFRRAEFIYFAIDVDNLFRRSDRGQIGSAERYVEEAVPPVELKQNPMKNTSSSS